MPNAKNARTSQPLAPWGLDGVDCNLCKNYGTLVRKDADGVLWGWECSCYPLRREIRQLNRQSEAGLIIVIEGTP